MKKILIKLMNLVVYTIIIFFALVHFELLDYDKINEMLFVSKQIPLEEQEKENKGIVFPDDYIEKTGIIIGKIQLKQLYISPNEYNISAYYIDKEKSDSQEKIVKFLDGILKDFTVYDEDVINTMYIFSEKKDLWILRELEQGEEQIKIALENLKPMAKIEFCPAKNYLFADFNNGRTVYLKSLVTNYQMIDIKDFTF